MRILFIMLFWILNVSLIMPVSDGSMSQSVNLQCKKVGFVVKFDDLKAEKMAIQLAQLALNEHCSVFFATESSSVQEKLSKVVNESQRTWIQCVDKSRLPDTTDFIVVIGGDGTLLSIARLMVKKSVPIMGINVGHLGFLTAVPESAGTSALQAMIEGNFGSISKRALCAVSLYRKNEKLFHGLALNDAVITKGAISRVIGLEISVNNCKAYDLRGDGLIISTPTGSTAYSLSAGGPLIFPSLEALVLTPICSHTLTQRPLVVPDTAEIKIRVTHRPGHVFLTLDGQDAVDLQEGDVVVINRFQNMVQLVEPLQQDYFALIRDKLHFAA